MGPQIPTSPLNSNRNRTSNRRLELESKLDQNWLQVAGTVRLEAGGPKTSMAPLGSSGIRAELEQEWDQPGGLEPNRNRTGRRGWSSGTKHKQDQQTRLELELESNWPGGSRTASKYWISDNSKIQTEPAGSGGP